MRGNERRKTYNAYNIYVCKIVKNKVKIITNRDNSLYFVDMKLENGYLCTFVNLSNFNVE